MKIAVLNFSGNVGKTTLAKHLLMPRMNNATLIPIESLNVDESTETAIRGRSLTRLRRLLAVADDAIVDVGASNIEEFMAALEAQDGAHEDFDAFLIPTTPSGKQQRDTINTIDALAHLGVPAERILVVFNLLDRTDSVEELFAPLFAYHAKTHAYTLKPKAAVHESELFGLVRDTPLSIAQLVQDSTDLRAQIREASDPADKIRLVDKLAARGMAVSVHKELDAVHRQLFAH